MFSVCVENHIVRFSYHLFTLTIIILCCIKLRKEFSFIILSHKFVLRSCDYKEMLIFSQVFFPKFRLLLQPSLFVAVCCGVTRSACQRPTANEMTLINQRMWRVPPESTNSVLGGQRREKLCLVGRTGQGVLNQVALELIK